MSEDYLDARVHLLNKSKDELVDMLLNKPDPYSEPLSSTLPNSTTELKGVYALLELLPDAYAFFDSNDCYLYCNKAYRELNSVAIDFLNRGDKYEDHLRNLISKGEIVDAIGREQEWFEERLERHHNPQGPFDLERPNGTFIRINEYKNSDGTQIMIVSDVSAQKQKEKALEESENARQLMSLAFNEISEGIALFDADDRLVFANKSWWHMTQGIDGVIQIGSTFEQLLWDCLNAGLLPHALENPTEWVAERMAKHKNPGKPFEVTRHDNRVHLVREQVLSNGCMISIISNITEQKHSQRRLEDAVESISDAFVLYDVDGNLIFANTKFKEVYKEIAHLMVPGVSFETLFRGEIEAGLHPERPQGIEAFVTQRVADFFKGDLTVERHLSDGRWLLVAERKTQNGETVGTRTDVTELKHREEEATRAEQKLLDAIESISEGFILFDDQERMVMRNSKYLDFFPIFEGMDMTGKTYEELVDIVVESDVVSTDEIDMKAWREQRLEQFKAVDGVHLEKIGDGRWIQSRERRTKSGGVVGIRTDVTDIVNAEKKSQDARLAAEKANRSKSAFLGNMSHELRTPLNAIIGFSTVLAGEVYGPIQNPFYLDYAGDIQRSGEHLLQLINDLLDISRIEAGEIGIDKAEVEFHAIVDDCIRMVESKCVANSINIYKAAPEILPTLYADDRHFKQILINIISNAIKFTPDHGSITIAAKPDGPDMVLITIADTGVGIAPENINLVLEPFGQVADTLTRDHDGVGLGLSIVKSLVELHDGALSLSSELDEGTTVSISMPVYKKP